MAAPTFPKSDPAIPEFWDLRYGARFAPWDAGRVPERLRAFVADARASGKAPNNVLVPGCGSAWDVRLMADAGWNVTGIDFSPQALAAARAVLGPHGARVREADFFAPLHGEPFEMVYERAFLCALPPRLWPRWALRMAQVVAPGGVLAGFFFFGEGERGPPFPLGSQADLDRLLAAAFERVEDEPVGDSIAAFAGKERWQVWRRDQSASPKSSDCG